MVNFAISILKDNIRKSLNNGKISSLLFRQLVLVYSQGIFEPDCILKQIRFLEGIDKNQTTTLQHEEFNGNILKGLYKKHFFQPNNINQNFIKIFSGVDVEKKLQKKFNIRIENKDFESTSGFVNLFDKIKKAVISSPDKTGDWLIYKKYDWGNYYISIATHAEGQNREESDMLIFNRIKGYLNFEKR